MLKEDFEQASVEVNNLTKRPSNEELLLLYAYYKQATQGDVNEEKPTGFDFKAIAKYSAWEKIKGMSSEDAMQNYIQLVQELKSKLS